MIYQATDTTYPAISDKLIDCLKNDFPNELPKDYITPFQLGILIGQQNIINKLIFEKEFNEKEEE